MDIDEAGNSSTGLQPCCLYPEADIDVRGKGVCHIKNTQSVLFKSIHCSFLRILFIKLKSNLVFMLMVTKDALNTSV